MRINRYRRGFIKRMVLWWTTVFATMAIVILILPGILVFPFQFEEGNLQVSTFPKDTAEKKPEKRLEKQKEAVMIPVYLTKQKRTVSIPLEDYVRGVLAAEMPIDFEIEALKAQAIASRTYLVRRLELGDRSELPSEAGDAIVTDSVQHQAYVTDEALRERWGWFAYARNIEKLTKAVNDTAGMVLTYNGQPIEATYFAASNGFTEHSELYWQTEIPYLRSVESPWDKQVMPDYQRKQSLSYREFYKKLGLSSSTKSPVLSIEEQSASGRNLRVKVNGKEFTGREVREKLGLASTDFTWRKEEGKVVITTTGSGHGVGMSQWGAYGMAKQGKKAEDILLHYYTGVRLENWEEHRMMASKKM